MAKVVINNSFGGFDLLPSISNKIAAATGFCPVSISCGFIPRHLPELVQAVEALHPSQRGSLRVVEVDGPYRISEYDGAETVVLMSQQNWIDPEAEIQYETYNRLPPSPEDNLASFDEFRIKGMNRSYGRKERRRFRCRPRRTVKFREVGTTEVEWFGTTYTDKVYMMVHIPRKGKRPAQKPKGKTLADKRKLFSKLMPEV